ncbi:Flagellum site-determining protein YlxH [Paraliobacillus sp. PM-2]|uniref:MinD/ParA family protein n=1 Tax=Paraliobacillus sp. PM-2 TaxID=1462524 RepID=UPI00061BD671|nr:MinD/ParA family protein [Paraliobacillus sp. PM-2]CQR47680.1 Flagellum site-determining protein YlxH [Paraliobacillus sp. PM-2]
MTDQAANLRRDMNRIKKNKQAKTISVVSGKGGVGKSNFSLNFAITLAKRHKKVLLFDLDIGMGNIDILMGVQPTQTIVEMYEKELPVYDIIESGPYSLSYIAGGSGLPELFQMSEYKQNYFLQQLNELLVSYDYIIFDMGAGASADTIRYILASDESVVVTTPEPTSIMDAYGMMKHIYYYNQDILLYLLVNQAQSTKEGEQTIKRLQQVTKRFLQMSITPLGILPKDKAVSKAVLSQTPFSLLEPNAKITRALNELAEHYETGKFESGNNGPSAFINKLIKFVKER